LDIVPRRKCGRNIEILAVIRKEDQKDPRMGWPYRWE
jgi:hypothetical protein